MLVSINNANVEYNSIGPTNIFTFNKKEFIHFGALLAEINKVCRANYLLSMLSYRCLLLQNGDKWVPAQIIGSKTDGYRLILENGEYIITDLMTTNDEIYIVNEEMNLKEPNCKYRISLLQGNIETHKYLLLNDSDEPEIKGIIVGKLNTSID